MNERTMSLAKVYQVNYDGRVNRGVYTTSKKRAAELLGVTVGTLNKYALIRDWEIETDAPLREYPDTPMESPHQRYKKDWYLIGSFSEYSVYQYECKRRGEPAQAFDDWIAKGH